MKHILPLILLLVIASCNGTKNEDTDNSIKYEYYEGGNLHKVYIYSSDGKLEYFNEYDEDGWLYRHVMYKDSKQKQMYEYDKNGNKTRETYFDSNGETGFYVLNEYNEDGKKSKKSVFTRSDVLTGYTSYTYDDDGNKSGHTDWSSDGRKIEQYSYDPKEIEQTSFDEKGKISYSETKGDMIRYFHYDDQGEIKYSYEYKKSDTSSNQLFYDSDGQLMNVYTYNDEGLKTRQENYSQGTMTGAIEYSYNDKGQVIKRQNFNALGNLDTYFIYEFDSRGKRTRVNVYDKNGKLKERL
jgi:antitoxin component YwqK of YwqJK toxin-antitoxin module